MGGTLRPTARHSVFRVGSVALNCGVVWTERPDQFRHRCPAEELKAYDDEIRRKHFEEAFTGAREVS